MGVLGLSIEDTRSISSRMFAGVSPPWNLWKQVFEEQRALLYPTELTRKGVDKAATLLPSFVSSR